MLFDGTTTLRLTRQADLTLQPGEQSSFSGDGLCIALLSSGTGLFLDNPTQSAHAGMLALGRNQLSFTAETPCHILAALLEGRIASDFLAGLPFDLYLAKGESCPQAAQLMVELLHHTDPLQQTQIAFALLCELGNADAAAPALPPLIIEAVEDIHNHYAELYGVDELSERLGVSKSHLVRSFHQAMGISPGKYLTGVRIQAAKQLLLHREYSLNVIASLCGFSGGNYLCRVFKKEVGVTPAVWRANALAHQTTLPHTEAERNLYV